MIDNKTLELIAIEVKENANDVVFDISPSNEEEIEVETEDRLYVIQFHISYSESYSTNEDRFFNPLDRDVTSIRLDDAYFWNSEDEKEYFSYDELKQLEQKLL